jgi:hypothetical protein
VKWGETVEKYFFDGQFSFLLPRQPMYDDGQLSFSEARKSYLCTVFSLLIILILLAGKPSHCVIDQS